MQSYTTGPLLVRQPAACVEIIKDRRGLDPWCSLEYAAPVCRLAMTAKITSAPIWSEIFASRPELEAPGYRETLEAIAANPTIKKKEVKKEEIKKKKLTKAVGRKGH